LGQEVEFDEAIDLDKMSPNTGRNKMGIILVHDDHNGLGSSGISLHSRSEGVLNICEVIDQRRS
jgi:hypothetical protein